MTAPVTRCRRAAIETWQPGADGRFDHPGAPDGVRRPGFCGFGRCPTDADGQWAVRTVKPGRVALDDGRLQAPYIAVSVFARSLLDQVVARIYFGDEEANAADPLLSTLAPRCGRWSPCQSTMAIGSMSTSRENR